MSNIMRSAIFSFLLLAAATTVPVFHFKLHVLTRTNTQPQVIDQSDSGCTSSDLTTAAPAAHALAALLVDLRSKGRTTLPIDAKASTLTPFSPHVVANANGTAAVELLPDFSNATVRAFFNCAYVAYAAGDAAKHAGLFVPPSADSARGAFVLDGWYGLYVIA